MDFQLFKKPNKDKITSHLNCTGKALYKSPRQHENLIMLSDFNDEVT